MYGQLIYFLHLLGKYTVSIKFGDRNKKIPHSLPLKSWISIYLVAIYLFLLLLNHLHLNLVINSTARFSQQVLFSSGNTLHKHCENPKIHGFINVWICSLLCINSRCNICSRRWSKPLNAFNITSYICGRLQPYLFFCFYVFLEIAMFYIRFFCFFY